MTEQKELPWLNPSTPEFQNAIKALNDGKTIDHILQFYKISKANRELLLSAAV